MRYFCFTFLKLKSQERHAMLEKDHVKPDGSTMDYEKNLVKIATRGGSVTIIITTITIIIIIIIIIINNYSLKWR